jgi:hypothetical protein
MKHSIPQPNKFEQSFYMVDTKISLQESCHTICNELEIVLFIHPRHINNYRLRVHLASLLDLIEGSSCFSD